MKKGETIMKCTECTHKDPVYWKDQLNGQYYQYKPTQIFLCLKHNKFIINKDLKEECQE